MAQIYEAGGFRVLMYALDKPPPFVHVVSATGWVFVALGDDEESVIGMGRFEMEEWEVRRAEMVVRSNWDRFRRKWEELHE